VVVIGHNRDEALKGGDLNDRTGVLCGFANNLHDVISLTLGNCKQVGSGVSVAMHGGDLYLSFKVVPDKVERVLESGNRGELDLGRRFVFASTVDNSCQNLV